MSTDIQSNEDGVGTETESTPTGSTESSIPDQSTSDGNASDVLAGDGAAGATETPDWTPNFKVKAYDQEFEIPEMYRSLMNKENEKEVRRIFEKAYAVDVMQPKHQKLREEFEGLNTKYSTVDKEHTTIKKNLDRLGKLVEIGDFGTFFDQIQIPREAIQKWMYNELQAQSLPPDQRALYDSQKALRERAYHAELEKDQIQESYSRDQATLTQYQVEKRQQELGLVLSKPEIATTAQNFDAAHGPGAFVKEVIERAQWAFEKQGKDLSAEEAVMAVAKLVGGGTQSQGQSSSVGAKPGSPPVIPHVEGRSTSPTKKLPGSIEDLKRMRQDRFPDSSIY